MLLTNKEEILEAMNKELAESSPSSIKWLADTFDVPLKTEKKKDISSISTKKETVHPKPRLAHGSNF
jgi:hypothetical protein